MLQPEIPSDFLMFDYSSSHLLNLEHFDRIPLVHNVLFTFGHNMQIYFPSFFQIEMGKKIAPLSLEKKRIIISWVVVQRCIVGSSQTAVTLSLYTAVKDYR